MGPGRRGTHRPKIAAVVRDGELRRELELSREYRITLAELQGWTPTETHRTVHPDGTETVTTVTRDSPWNDEQRDLLRAYDLLICSMHGGPIEECDTEGVDRVPRTRICHIAADQAEAQRIMRETYGDEVKDNRHPADGLTFWLEESADGD